MWWILLLSRFNFGSCCGGVEAVPVAVIVEIVVVPVSLVVAENKVFVI